MAKMLGRLAMLGTARKYASEHSDQVNGGIDKVAGMVKGRAGQHGDKVDKAASFLKKAATGNEDRRGSGRSARRRAGSDGRPPRSGRR